MWHMTCDRWHVTRDRWHMTHYRWGGGKPFLKISAFLLLRFGIEGVLKIFSQRKTQSMNKWITKVFVEQPGYARSVKYIKVWLLKAHIDVYFRKHNYCGVKCQRLDINCIDRLLVLLWFEKRPVLTESTLCLLIICSLESGLLEVFMHKAHKSLGSLW